MKGAHEALPTSMDRLPSVDLPRVLVGASTTAASSSVAHALREVGYVVNTALTGADVLRELRNQKAIELLVFDGSDTPWLVAETIDAVRAINWAMPIVLILRHDPVLYAEAERLGVEAILEVPVAADDIRRVATKLVPVVPELEFKPASSRADRGMAA